VLTLLLVSILTIVALNAALALTMALVRLRLVHRNRSRGAVMARWEPRIQSLLVGESSAATLHPLVRPTDRDHLVEVLTEYGLRLSGVELERLRSFGRPLLGVAHRELGARQAERRARGVQTLGVLGGPARSADLARMLADESPLVAMVAASWLSLVGDREPAAEVVAHLDRFDLWSPHFLASMLAEGGPTMVEHLRRALADPAAAERSRAVAGDALRLLKDPGAAEVAAGVLRAEPDREIAASCLRILQRVGTADQAGIVRDYASGDDFVLRALAMTALGSLGADEADIALLDDGLDDSSPWVALHAAEALLASDHLEVLRRAAMSRRPGAEAAGEILLGGAA
jgi:hypothetical protein